MTEKAPRKVFTKKNRAKADFERNRVYFENTPVYEFGASHSSEGRIRVGLSSSSVYPMNVETTFAIASELGFDGVEIMITDNAGTQSASHILEHAERTGLPVLSLHAPTLLLLPRVMHKDRWQMLRMTAQLAEDVGAETVVLHPPFRWQGDYARGFVDGVRRLTRETGIKLAVENMYPWRAGVRELQIYYPDWNPLDEDYDHMTFDFSHASTAGMNALSTLKEIHDKVRVLHVTDGAGSLMDEHLVPGRGKMPVKECLQYLAKVDWSGEAVIEVNTRFVAKKSTRMEMLAESLAFTREHLGLNIKEAESAD